eukprot:scaffold81738_cov72-Attheya_sp.AAC.1
MAQLTPTGRPPLGPPWYATNTTQPSQLINDLDVQYQKQEEKYTQYTLNATIISTTTSTARPMRYNFEADLDKVIKKYQDSYQDSLDKMLELMLAQNRELIHTLLQDTMKQIRSTIDDPPDAQYEKDNKNYIRYQLETNNVISTATSTSPTRYNLHGIHKRNKQYRKSTMKEIQSTIDDPDAQYQKKNENDIRYQSETNSISTSTSTSPTRYDIQGIYKRNKQYRESLHIIEEHMRRRVPITSDC